MAKQVIIALGSPRKNGNCAVLTEQAAKGAQASGANTEIINLHELNIQPCTACDACQNSTRTECIIDDELTAILPRLRRVDALIIASPVYWFTFSAQTKLFIDRAFYALNGPEGHTLKGRPIGLIMTYADVDAFKSGAVNALHAFQDICNFIEASIAGMVYGSAMGAGDIKKQTGVLKEAFQLGEKLGAK